MVERLQLHVSSTRPSSDASSTPHSPAPDLPSPALNPPSWLNTPSTVASHPSHSFLHSSKRKEHSAAPWLHTASLDSQTVDPSGGHTTAAAATAAALAAARAAAAHQQRSAMQAGQLPPAGGDLDTAAALHAQGARSAHHACSAHHRHWCSPASPAAAAEAAWMPVDGLYVRPGLRSMGSKHGRHAAARSLMPALRSAAWPPPPNPSDLFHHHCHTKARVQDIPTSSRLWDGPELHSPTSPVHRLPPHAPPPEHPTHPTSVSAMPVEQLMASLEQSLDLTPALQVLTEAWSCFDLTGACRLLSLTWNYCMLASGAVPVKTHKDLVMLWFDWSCRPKCYMGLSHALVLTGDSITLRLDMHEAKGAHGATTADASLAHIFVPESPKEQVELAWGRLRRRLLEVAARLREEGTKARGTAACAPREDMFDRVKRGIHALDSKVGLAVGMLGVVGHAIMGQPA
eukprot:scaffold178737_cov16-Tisochrysis_lutea.AAC.1